MIRSAHSVRPRLEARLTGARGQVQIDLEGKPLFVSSDAISFLGEDAARTIGDGARWRHPFPQSWSWPPKEPAQVSHVSSNAAEVDEPAFLKEYEAKPSVTVHKARDGVVAMEADLQNLGGAPKQAWIVAPFAMPQGHSATSPKALAVFPASDQELDAIPDGPATGGRWQEDPTHHLLFVNPGGGKAEGQDDKLLLSDRWSAFAREGDSALLVMPGTGATGKEAFQVFAAFDGYLEMEWAGEAARPGETSSVTAKFQAVPLSTLGLKDDHGRPLERFGTGGQGLQAEITEALSHIDTLKTTVS